MGEEEHARISDGSGHGMHRRGRRTGGGRAREHASHGRHHAHPHPHREGARGGAIGPAHGRIHHAGVPRPAPLRRAHPEAAGRAGGAGREKSAAARGRGAGGGPWQSQRDRGRAGHPRGGAHAGDAPPTAGHGAGVAREAAGRERHRTRRAGADGHRDGGAVPRAGAPCAALGGHRHRRAGRL